MDEDPVRHDLPPAEVVFATGVRHEIETAVREGRLDPVGARAHLAAVQFIEAQVHVHRPDAH